MLSWPGTGFRRRAQAGGGTPPRAPRREARGLPAVPAPPRGGRSLPSHFDWAAERPRGACGHPAGAGDSLRNALRPGVRRPPLAARGPLRWRGRGRPPGAR